MVVVPDNHPVLHPGFKELKRHGMIVRNGAPCVVFNFEVRLIVLSDEPRAVRLIIAALPLIKNWVKKALDPNHNARVGVTS